LKSGTGIASQKIKGGGGGFLNFLFFFLDISLTPCVGPVTALNFFQQQNLNNFLSARALIFFKKDKKMLVEKIPSSSIKYVNDCLF
jgi:hypothetical protein